MIQFPNRTAQEGVFREGTPNYVELASGSALPGMKRFLVRAVSDEWSDEDTLGILLKGMGGEYQVWTGKWNSDDESIECEVLEDSDGVLEDGDPVFVLAMMTRELMIRWKDE